jgi:hypothetical protein
MNKNLLFLLLLHISLNISAIGISRDTTYIKDFSKFFILKFQTTIRSTELELKNLQVNKAFKIMPNDSRSFGLAFSYKWLGLSIGITPSYLNNDNKIYGKTNRFDFQVNTYSKWYLMNIYAQWYKGFYVSNPKTFDKNWNETYFPTIPEGQLANFGGSFFFMLNPEKLSFRSVYLGNEVQLKKAGSWLFGGGFNSSFAHSKKCFLPDIWIDSPVIDTISILKGYNFFHLFASAGGSYTFVWFNGKLFLNLYLMLNMGPYLGSATLYQNTKTFTRGNLDFSTSTDARLSFGGNIGKRNKFFWGLYIVAFRYNYNIKSYYDISPFVKNAKLYFGYRFI